MAVKPKSKKVEEIAKDFHNEVHDRLGLLFKEFSEERRKGIKDKFEEVVAYPAIDILREIVGSEGLDTEEKLAALKLVHDAAAKMALELESPSLFEAGVEQSRERWKDRVKKNKERAIDFIRRVYNIELQNGTLTKPMLRRDIELYQAYNSHLRNYPEDDLNLKTKSDVIDDEIAVLDTRLSKRLQSLASTKRMRNRRDAKP